MTDRMDSVYFIVVGVFVSGGFILVTVATFLANPRPRRRYRGTHRDEY